ncbi:MAG: hypothetical protein N2109_02445 [Fimbriimonadales bacterium]|nr:hypothetical protein [Fimbriimonadales bacterium]
MRQSGRVHWMVAVAVALLVAIVALIFFAGESPAVVTGRFLYALQLRDVDTLTELSYVPEGDAGHIRDDWDFTVNVANPNYRFTYRVLHVKELGGSDAVATVEMKKDAFSPAAYEENFQLPLVRKDGKWKVDVYNLSRKMYPALPRPREGSDAAQGS